MISLTNKQHKLLQYIRAHLAANGNRAPSFEEMKAAMGLKSKSGVHRLISALEQRGHLYRIPNHARAIGLTEHRDWSALLSQVPTFDLCAEVERRTV